MPLRVFGDTTVTKREKFLLGLIGLLIAACLILDSAFGQAIFRNADQVLNAVFDSTNSLLKVEFSNTSADPCLVPGVAKSSATISLTATAQLVALVSGQTVYVCNASFTAATGTAATYQFQYGTGTNCGTGTTNLTGTMIGGSPISLGWGGTSIKTGASNALCLALGGTTPSAQGVVTYIQQ